MTERFLHSMVFLAAAAVSLGYGLSVVFMDYMRLPEYLPDDAYYYLQIARVLAQEGLYSFDNGLRTNTGFHLLWFYIVAAASALIDGDAARLANVAVAICWLVSLATLLIAAVFCYRRYSVALIVIATMLSGYGFVNNHISALEWPLCILISTCIYLAVLSDRKGGTGLIFFGLGLLGVFARTDFLGVPVAFIAAAYLTRYKVHHPQFVVPARNLLLGAVLAFLIVGLHNYWIAGDWLSTSARTKQHWGSTVSVNPMAPLFQFVCSVIYIAPLTDSERVELRQQVLHVALLALLVYYLSKNSRRAAMLCTAISAVIIVVNFTILFISPATYAHQSSMRDIGLAVADAVAQGELPKHVGISDAGIAGYFSNGHVVNLDGLVNKDIVDYFPARLPCYFHDKGMEYAGGFGTSELLGQPIEWPRFSQAYHYRKESGEAITLRQLDLENIDRIYGCTNAPLVWAGWYPGKLAA